MIDITYLVQSTIGNLNFSRGKGRGIKRIKNVQIIKILKMYSFIFKICMLLTLKK